MPALAPSRRASSRRCAGARPSAVSPHARRRPRDAAGCCSTTRATGCGRSSTATPSDAARPGRPSLPLYADLQRRGRAAASTRSLRGRAPDFRARGSPGAYEELLADEAAARRAQEALSDDDQLRTAPRARPAASRRSAAELASSGHAGDDPASTTSTTAMSSRTRRPKPPRLERALRRRSAFQLTVRSNVIAHRRGGRSAPRPSRRRQRRLRSTPEPREPADEHRAFEPSTVARAEARPQRRLRSTLARASRDGPGDLQPCQARAGSPSFPSKRPPNRQWLRRH